MSKLTIHLFYEDMDPSIRFETPTHTVTAYDIDTFADISGDTNPLHTNEQFAKKTQFGSRIAHGALVLSIATGLAYHIDYLSRAVEAFIELNWKYRAPVKIGDSIRAKFQFIKKRAMPNYSGGLVTFRVAVVNQNDETVQKGLWTLLVRNKAN